MKKSFKKFVCISGLPRAGSTLLSAILSQNPMIHAEGNSAVCQIMVDMHRSCHLFAAEQLNANNRHDTKYDLIASVPHIYYKNINESIVVDKCRAWTLHIPLLKTYIDKKIKIIVLERSILDIVKSFVRVYRKNGIFDAAFEDKLVHPKTNPLMIPLEGLKWARENNIDNTFLFIKYDDLILNTKETIQKIYDFCGWQSFDHDYDSINPKYRENDSVYQYQGISLHGLHDLRKTISREKNDIVLHKHLEEKCKELDRYFFN
jgi:sulfotransferase